MDKTTGYVYTFMKKKWFYCPPLVTSMCNIYHTNTTVKLKTIQLIII